MSPPSPVTVTLTEPPEIAVVAAALIRNGAAACRAEGVIAAALDGGIESP